MHRFQSFKLQLANTARFQARPVRNETPEQKQARETRETVASIRAKLQAKSR